MVAKISIGNSLYGALTYNGEKAKEKIEVAPTKRMVSAALAESTGKEDFIAKLKVKNIDLVLRYTDEGRIYGATFIDHNTQTVLNGSRLGKEFSANALENRFNQPQAVPIVPVTPISPVTPIEPEATHAEHEAQSDTVHGPDSTLPGLDLFTPGMSFNPDEEEFRHRMQRKKKKRRGPKL